MRTHTTPRRSVRTVVALTVTAALAATTAAVAPSASATVVYPKVTSLSAEDRTNPLRGQYRWIGTGAVPSTWDSPDLYPLMR